MADNRLQDSSYLRDVAYRDASRLNARAALWQRYASGRDLTKEGLFNLTAVPDDAKVLEVGCGTASLWAWALENEKLSNGWRITLTDLSEGMLAEARNRLGESARSFDFAVADVSDLPYADDSFDLIVAMHMLYHVPDVDAALGEIRRVLKPGGTLYATTNGTGHVAEIAELRQRFGVAGEPVIAPAHMAFSLETGKAAIERIFSQVAVHADDEVLKIDDPSVLVGYVESMSSEVELEKLRAHVEAVISERGFFPVTRSSGAIVAG